MAAAREVSAALNVTPMGRESVVALLTSWYEMDLKSPQLEDLTERLRGLRAELLTRVFGQDHAVQAFVEVLPDRVTVDALLAGFEVVEVEPVGPSPGNVICLGDGELITSGAENASAVEALDRRGMTVHGLDLSEFRKGGGGPTCLILPVSRGS